MSLGTPRVILAQDVHTFRFEDIGVEVICERFSETKDDVSCEADFRALDGTRFHRGKLLLLGPRSRADALKQLKAADPDKPWGPVLEVVCNASLDAYRVGSPVVRLADVPHRDRPQHILYPFITEHGVTCIFGDGGVSKSTFALAMAIAVASGNNLLEQPPTRTGPVLYLDWEADAQTHAQRLEAICKGAEMEAPRDVLYKQCVASLPELSQDISNDIEREGAVLAVVDSGGAACGGDSETSTDVIKMFRGIRSFGVPTLLVHHIRKDQTDKTKPFGSVYAHNLSRLTWGLEGVETEEGLSVAFRNHKANYDRKEPQRGYTVEYESTPYGLTCVRFNSSDPRSVPGLQSNRKMQIGAILRLNDGPMTSAELHNSLCGSVEDPPSDATIRTTLNRYTDWFSQDESGNWSLV